MKYLSSMYAKYQFERCLYLSIVHNFYTFVIKNNCKMRSGVNIKIIINSGLVKEYSNL